MYPTRIALRGRGSTWCGPTAVGGRNRLRDLPDVQQRRRSATSTSWSIRILGEKFDVGCVCAEKMSVAIYEGRNGEAKLRNRN